HGHRRDADPIALVGKKSIENRWRSDVDGVDAGIGVEPIAHGDQAARRFGAIGSRSSWPVGCSRSSRNPGSNSPRASSRLRIEARGQELRTTLSPCRRTYTSVPLKRNSFGRRTAWLRPCWNNLARGWEASSTAISLVSIKYISSHRRGQRSSSSSKRLRPEYERYLRGGCMLTRTGRRANECRIRVQGRRPAELTKTSLTRLPSPSPRPPSSRRRRP